MFMMFYQVLGLLDQCLAHGELRCALKDRKTTRKGKICAPWSQFPLDLWQIKCTEFMENIFLMLYQVLGLLKANGGPWGAERQGEFSPI
jgi:hypothetical protein